METNNPITQQPENKGVPIHNLPLQDRIHKELEAYMGNPLVPLVATAIKLEGNDIIFL